MLSQTKEKLQTWVWQLHYAVLTTCCILVLMSGLFICDVPTNAGKNTNRAATADQDPFGIWGEKAKLYFFGFGYATIFSHTSAANVAHWHEVGLTLDVRYSHI